MIKKIGLIKTVSRVNPKKASTCRVSRKIADSTRNQRVFFSRYFAANYGNYDHDFSRAADAAPQGRQL